MKETLGEKKSRNIGFIGLGLMGKPMAMNLIKAGFNVIVYNRTKSKAMELAEYGAKVAETPAELGRKADIIFSILLSGEIVKEMVTGKGGILKGLRAGSIFIDMTTVAPAMSRELEKVFKAARAGYLEAPVIRGPRGAREGNLMILVGGEQKTFDKCKDLLYVLGKDIYYLGPVGKAAAAKLLNNYITHLNLGIICEALALAKKADIPLDELLEIWQKGSANSYVLQDRTPGIIKRSFDLKATLEIAYKDMGLILDLAGEFKALALFPAILRQIHQIGLGMGLASQDTSNIIKVFEKFYIQEGSKG